MRLIDADAIRLKQGFFEEVDNVPKFYDWLDEQPTVNAIPLDDFFPNAAVLNNVNEVKIRGKKFVSVVRCGECRHKCGEYDGYVCCDKNVWRDPNWFCADGERKR